MSEHNPGPQAESFMHPQGSLTLDPMPVLVAEFEYIAQSAFQANEDRARVTNFYIVSVGSLVAAIFSSQFTDAGASTRIPVYWAFAALFVILSVTGLTTTIQLAQLRISWYQCVAAMNQIKEYTADRAAGANLSDAFLWTRATRPALFKGRSISFLLVLQVSLLGGCTLAAAVLSAGLNYGRWVWGLATGCGLAFALAQVLVYRRLLRQESAR